MHRSYWIPGSYAPMLSEKHNSFLRLLKNKGFKEERMTKIELYTIGKSKTLESNKSLVGMRWNVKFSAHCGWRATMAGRRQRRPAIRHASMGPFGSLGQ